MKVLAITQARLASSRLPEKVLMRINNLPLLSIHLDRLSKSKKIDKLIVATTNEIGVEAIIQICLEKKISYYQGSVDDVLERFYLAAITEMPDWVVRITSDCPLIDVDLVDKIIEYAINSNFDYVSNTLNPTYPDGVDVEVFRFEALQLAFNEAFLKSDREHVTPFIWKNSDFKGGNKFRAYSFENDKDFSSLRFTVDTKEDFDLVKTLIELIGNDKDWYTYANTLNLNEELKDCNRQFKRNEGYEKSLKIDNL